ncbi:MAG: hypothetical protein ACR2QC_08940 [Gammaproteobacteria bacterium]
MYAFGERDSGPRVREDKLSPEWRVFYIFGYRQIRYCPQKQKAPPFRRKPESFLREAQTDSPLAGLDSCFRRNGIKEIPAFAGMVYFNSAKRFRLSPEWRHF